MEENTIRKFRWFWAWNDDKEEAWLREMAAGGYTGGGHTGGGWHLKQVSFPGIYTFEKGAPKDVAYRLDFFIDHKDKANYLQIFNDAGWEHVGEYGSWQYFRKDVADAEAGAGAPEIFTDNESKVKKYQRLLTFLAIILMPMYTTLITHSTSSDPKYGFLSVIRIFIACMMVFFVYAIIRLFARINQLKKQQRL